MTAPHPRGGSGLVLLAGLLLLLAACGSAPPGIAAPPPSLPKNAQVPWPADLPAAESIRCPATGVEVSTSAELRTALRTAVPGAVIGLADGVYDGMFTASGIEAGAEIRVEGMLARGKDMPTIFNPRYEIMSRQENE